MSELLAKYFAGTLSDDEKQLLFNSIETDEELKKMFVRWQNVFAVSGMVEKEDDSYYVRRKYEEIRKQIENRKKRRLYMSFCKYAAVIFLLISTWFLSRIFMSEPMEEFTCIDVPKGQQIHVTLPDQSDVWLSSRSQLKFSNRFNAHSRNVELDGEAFFSVQKDTQRPFVVQTDKYDIKVTGTQFNVFAYSESPMFETDLVEGAVFVLKENDNEYIQLRPKEKVVLEEGVLRKETSSFMETQYIKNGIYAFEDKTIQEIANRLELWYDVKIKIRDAAIANSIIHGKFRQTDHIDNILKAIKETGKFDYTLIDDKEVELYE